MSPEQTAKRLETFKRNRLLELGQKVGQYCPSKVIRDNVNN